jgi:hypothetical protein
MGQGFTQATLEGDVTSKFVNRHPPIGNKDEDRLWVQKMTQCQVKRWPSTKLKTKVWLIKPKDLDYPQKFLLRVVAHLVSQTHFISSLSNLGDEISFKGGSL